MRVGAGSHGACWLEGHDFTQEQQNAQATLQGLSSWPLLGFILRVKIRVGCKTMASEMSKLTVLDGWTALGVFLGCGQVFSTQWSDGYSWFTLHTGILTWAPWTGLVVAGVCVTPMHFSLRGRDRNSGFSEGFRTLKTVQSWDAV